MDWQKEAATACAPPVNPTPAPPPFSPLLWQHVAQDSRELAQIQYFHLQRLFHSLQEAAAVSFLAASEANRVSANAADPMQIHAPPTCAAAPPAVDAILPPVSFEFTVRVTEPTSAV